jgi:hypothetical protein
MNGASLGEAAPIVPPPRAVQREQATDQQRAREDQRLDDEDLAREPSSAQAAHACMIPQSEATDSGSPYPTPLHPLS